MAGRDPAVYIPSLLCLSQKVQVPSEDGFWGVERGLSTSLALGVSRPICVLLTDSRFSERSLHVETTARTCGWTLQRLESFAPGRRACLGNVPMLLFVREAEINTQEVPLDWDNIRETNWHSFGDKHACSS